MVLMITCINFLCVVCSDIPRAIGSCRSAVGEEAWILFIYIGSYRFAVWEGTFLVVGHITLRPPPSVRDIIPSNLARLEYYVNLFG